MQTILSETEQYDLQEWEQSTPETFEPKPAKIRNRKPTGYILWRGNGIVVIATGFARKSANKKTGNMIQTWILVDDTDPVNAVRSGHDVKVCGNCPLRGICYVDKGKAPLSVYKKFRAGGYPSLLDHSVFNGRKTRIGSYGDPAFVPVSVWQSVVRNSDGHTGYSHQWRTSPQLRELVMASVETMHDQIDATRQGWRTFRVRKAGQARFADEIQCPASDESGNKTTCEKCRLCSGTSKRAKSIVINAHGPSAKSLDL